MTLAQIIFEHQPLCYNSQDVPFRLIGVAVQQSAEGGVQCFLLSDNDSHEFAIPVVHFWRTFTIPATSVTR